MVDELTEIQSDNLEGETTEKKKRGRKPGTSKKDKISYEEAEQKLCRVFNGICTILKLKKRFTEKDFAEEAKDLERMAGKYEVIHIILTILDPLFFLLGLIDKGSSIIQEKKLKEQQEKSKEEGGNQQ